MIRCDEVTKIFRKNGSEVTSLDRFTAKVAEGEFVAVRGPSGSGKTTLLLTLGGMQRPSAGSVQLAGRDLYALSPAERARLRSSEIGFVFQMFHLVPYLDLLGNVLLACPGKPSAEVRQRARGFPIVGTTLDYFAFRQLQIRHGTTLIRLGDCVLGAGVARKLGLEPGDRLLSDPENVFDIAGAYPLNMRVVGVLDDSHAPDDNAVFVDQE